MIKFSLNCKQGHEFEAWFNNNDDFDKQSKKGLVECPYCGDIKISKSLMAPSLNTGRKKRRENRL